jgi:uncharacterized protein YydD (DUF2326 family)
MRLLRLYSNQPQFREVIFNPTGLTVIVGSKGDTATNKSSNGVGKSLIIRLLHFCLGCNKIKDIETKLSTYTFFLEVEINANKYTFERETRKQDKIKVNGIEQSPKDFTNWLGRILFNLNDETGALSFRSLISRFIRPNRNSYSAYNKYIEDEDKKPAITLLNNAYLLGLSIDLILKKKILKEDIRKNKALREALKKNDAFVKNLLVTGTKTSTIDITITNLEASIKNLEVRINSLRIAENYSEMTKIWNKVKYDLEQKRNQRALNQMSLDNLLKTLEQRPALSKEKVEEMYNEANIYLSETIKKRLEEVQIFNDKIIKDRETRLKSEKINIEKLLKSTEKEIRALEQEDDDWRVKLTNKGSHDDYHAVNKSFIDKKMELQSLQQYVKLTTEYDQYIADKDIEIKQIISQTIEYITNAAKKTIEDNTTFFMNMAQQIYTDLPTSGISVKYDDGDNQTALQIKAHIQAAASDGINDALTFCFDWTLLHFKHNHNIDFLVHDSRITDHFSNTEQRSNLIKLAYHQSIKDNVQYIIGMNEENWKAILDETTEDEIKQQLEKSVTLELSFDNLLLGGKHIDLDYEA